MAALPLAALLWLAATPSGAEATLRAQCEAGASDPRNPWALAHGINTFGPTFRARGGRLAADVIVHDFLRWKDGAPGFDPAAPDGTPIDPHPALLVKTLVLAGVPLSHPFETSSRGKVTLGHLVLGVERAFQPPPPGNEVAWAKRAWALDVIASTHGLGDNFRSSDGEQINVARLMADALAALERAQASLGEAMDAGRPMVEKRKQGIYAHPCGGLHFVQAVAGWAARHPEIRTRWAGRLARQVDILFYRLDSEARQYDAAIQALPGQRLRVRAQELKFYGHLLETLGRMRAEGTFSATPRQREAIARASERLSQAVEDLERLGAFRNSEQLQREQPQLFLDLIGDACHGARGLGAWR